MLQTRFDAGGKVLFSVGDGLGRPYRIVVERDLCRPMPVAHAKTHFELPGAGCRDHLAGAMAVNQTLQLCEELQ